MKRRAFQRIGFASALLSVLTWIAPLRALSSATNDNDDAFSWTLAAKPQDHFAFADLGLDNRENPSDAVIARALASRFVPRVLVHDHIDRPISATAFFSLAGNDRGPETYSDFTRLQQQLTEMQQRQEPNAHPNPVALKLQAQISFLQQELWIKLNVDADKLTPSEIWNRRAAIDDATLCGLQAGWSVDLNSNRFGSLDRPVGYVRVRRVFGRSDTGKRHLESLLEASQELYSIQYLLLFPNNDVHISHPAIAGDFSRYDHEGDWCCFDYTVSLPRSIQPAPNHNLMDEVAAHAKFLGLILHNHGRQFMICPSYWPGAVQQTGQSIPIYLERGTHEPHPDSTPRVPEDWNQIRNVVRVNHSPPEQMARAAKLGLAGERHVIHDHDGTVELPIKWQILPAHASTKDQSPPLGIWLCTADRLNTDGFLLCEYRGRWGDSVDDGDSPQSPYFNSKMANREFEPSGHSVVLGPSAAEIAKQLLLWTGAAAYAAGILGMTIGAMSCGTWVALGLGVLIGVGTVVIMAGLVILIVQFEFGDWGDGGDGNDGSGEGRGSSGQGEATTPEDMLGPPIADGDGHDNGWRANMDRNGLVRVFHKTFAPASPVVARVASVCDDGQTTPGVIVEDWVNAAVHADPSDNATPTEAAFYTHLGERYCVALGRTSAPSPRIVEAQKDCLGCGPPPCDLTRLIAIPKFSDNPPPGCEYRAIGLCDGRFHVQERDGSWSDQMTLPMPSQATVLHSQSDKIPVRGNPAIGVALFDTRVGRVVGAFLSPSPPTSDLFWIAANGDCTRIALPLPPSHKATLSNRVCIKQESDGERTIVLLNVGSAGPEWTFLRPLAPSLAPDRFICALAAGDNVYVRFDEHTAEDFFGNPDSIFAIGDDGLPMPAEGFP